MRPLFKLRVPVADIDAGRSAAGLLGELIDPPALAVTLLEDAAPAYLVEAYYQDEPATGAIGSALTALGPSVGSPRLEMVPDANWVAISQAALPPIQAGRFIVHGSHDRARVGLRPFAIEVEAGEAFGTGHNATTSGCLEAIDRLTRRQRFGHVLDLGCGTGVLAIAAARALPAARIIASDNDPVATAIARENMRLNRVAGRVRVVTATGLAHPLLRRSQTFDLIVANILPRPLIALAPTLHRALRAGGIAILSGLLNPQAGQVVASYRAAGFHLDAVRRHGGWTVLTLARIQTSAG
jgi:ribosomal protein L11 methyltransferase